MFIYLVVLVVLICSIFGLVYSQTSFGVVSNGIATLSTNQVPAFVHSAPLNEHSQAGVVGDNRIAGGISQESLEISSEGMEEASRSEENDQNRLKDDRYHLERRTFDQNLREASQLGIAESLWSPAPQSQKYSPDGSKPAAQKINTNTIFNMIQYETFKEAMAVLQAQQEEEEAARAAASSEQIGKSLEK